jgi:hypothetical protein
MTSSTDERAAISFLLDLAAVDLSADTQLFGGGNLSLPVCNPVRVHAGF